MVQISIINGPKSILADSQRKSYKMTSVEVTKLKFNSSLDEIEALNQKRTLAFINHWVYHTVLFLNQFSSICQQKLSMLETKIRRANDLLSTLESKLSSIPGLEDDVIPIYSENANNLTQEPQATDPLASSVTTGGAKDQDQKPSNESNCIESSATEPRKKIPISSHPDFAPYFKMVNFGVPREAVKLKMTASGIDSSLLDDPSAEVDYKEKDGGPANSSSDSSTSSQTSD